MIIQVSHLSKSYETASEPLQILKDINFSIKEGEWINVIGPSGSGKTTLLKCVAGLIDSDGGSQIKLKDIPIHEKNEKILREFRRKNIGFIYQDYQLFDAYTAKQNVMLPEWPYRKRDELEKKAEEILVKLNLEDRMNARPSDLSGGEKQRVAIARALLNDPSLLICDEPTGNLDRQSRNDVLQILKNCQKEGRTILFVTHDYEILDFGNRIFRLTDGMLEEVDKEMFVNFI